VTTAQNANIPAPQSTSIAPTISNATNQIGSLGSTYSGLGASVLPQAQQTTQNLYNNPYASTAMAGATGAAGLGAGAANAQYNTGASLVPYAQQILNTGFDPQNALYNQLQQQNLQQGAVNNAQAGVATTPYGAGLQDQSNQNFNINWQNQQLGRQTQAATAAEGLDTTGTGLMAAAPTTLASTSAIPYATYSGIGQGQDAALSSLLGIGGQGANLSNMSVQDLLGLLTGQNNTNQVANQAGANSLQQQNSIFSQLGSIGSGIGSFLGLGTGGGTTIGGNLAGMALGF